VGIVFFGNPSAGLKLTYHCDRLYLWKDKHNSPSLTLASGSGLFFDLA
jgi:hypothetical protein